MKALKYTSAFCSGIAITFSVVWSIVLSDPKSVNRFYRIETQEPEPTYQNETIYKPAPKYVDEYDSVYWKQTHY